MKKNYLIIMGLVLVFYACNSDYDLPINNEVKRSFDIEGYKKVLLSIFSTEDDLVLKSLNTENEVSRPDLEPESDYVYEFDISQRVLDDLTIMSSKEDINLMALSLDAYIKGNSQISLSQDEIDYVNMVYESVLAIKEYDPTITLNLKNGYLYSASQQACLDDYSINMRRAQGRFLMGITSIFFRSFKGAITSVIAAKKEMDTLYNQRESCMSSAAMTVISESDGDGNVPNELVPSINKLW